MKFFIRISLISAIIQMNLCQSYEKTDPLVMIVNEKDIILKEGEWLTPFDNMEESEQKKLCEYTLKARFFIFSQPKIIDYVQLYWRDYVLTSNLKIITSVHNSVFKEQPIQLLECKTEFSFLLAKYSKHEGYILFAVSALRIMGVVTTFFSYQKCSKEEKLRLWQDQMNVKNVIIQNFGKTKISKLNVFNQQKLCATIMNIPIPRIKDMKYMTKRNVPLKATLLNEAILFLRPFCLECLYEAGNSSEKGIRFCLTQLPEPKNRVLLFNFETEEDLFDVFDIREFEEEGSSAN